MERDYAYTIGRAFEDLQRPEWVGAECARRTLSRLEPRKPSTMKAPVIFASEVATGLFGHLPRTELADMTQIDGEAVGGGLPLMVHIGNNPPDLTQIADLLTSDDIITHFLTASPTAF